MKKLVSLKLSKQSVPVKIENARHCVTTMTGNANFTSPIPTLASITTAINNLETAFNNALGGGKALKALVREKSTILDNLLIQLSHYVEATANGSEAIILSAGMNVKALTGGRRAVGFSVKKGEREGTLKLSTSFEKNHAYVWEMAEDILPNEGEGSSTNSNWEQIGITVKASFIKEGLEITKKYWFRVASIGSNGQNPWSDPIARMVTE